MSTVTAIVSAYYAEEYIEGRLLNLIEQEPRPEIVVVCQANSVEYTTAKQHPVSIITTPDIPTIYHAWNLGIEQAHGDYITNANSDDRLYPGALAELAKVLDKNEDVGISYSWVDIVETIGGDPVSRFQWSEGGFDELMHGCFMGPFPMWRKSLHDEYGLFDGTLKVAGDYEMWLRLLKNGVQCSCINHSLGAYLSRPDSAEHREEITAVWETARVRARHRRI